MNCVLWSMGDASLHGMGTSSGARQCGVTHVPGLKCYLCLRTVPYGCLTSCSSGPASPAAQRLTVRRSDRYQRKETIMTRLTSFWLTVVIAVSGGLTLQ